MHLVPDLPGFSWYPAEPVHAWDGTTLSITAGPRSDWFVDPVTGLQVPPPDGLPAGPAPILRTPAPGPGTFAATVTTGAAAMFDAGTLYAFVDETSWGKLALERNPAGDLTLVSVVTNGRSDDCNHRLAPGAAVPLRVTVLGGGAFAFHAREGSRWELLRLFRLAAALDEGAVTYLGVSSQSPVGEGNRATFSAISWSPSVPPDLRDGS